MRENLDRRAEELKRRGRWRRRWEKLLAAMACVVVFCTTYALILPAITLDQSVVCGKEEHTHTDACYRVDLTCGNTDEEHFHAAECYTKLLVCEKEEHTHTDSCYQKETDAPQTQASETQSPETSAPETQAAETQATETQATETQAPETAATETTATETNAPETETGKETEPETGKKETERPEKPTETESGTETETETELPLTEQTLEVSVYKDSSYTEACEEDVEITLKGELPEGVLAKAYPTKITLEDETLEVVEAYDITLFLPKTDGESGEVTETAYEPAGPIEVKIRSEKLKELDTVQIYHLADEPDAEPELLKEQLAVDAEDRVTFTAEAFSVYAVAAVSADEPEDETGAEDEKPESRDAGEENAATTYPATIVYYRTYDDETEGPQSTEEREISFGTLKGESGAVPTIDGWIFKGAYAVTDDGNYTGVEIASVSRGADGNIYYHVGEENAGTQLTDGHSIALHYVPAGTAYKVVMEEDGAYDVAGNAFSGVPQLCRAGEGFSFQVSTARGYTATVDMGDGTERTVASGETETISVSNVSADVNMKVTYQKVGTVTFDPNVFQNSSYKYLYDNGTARFTTNNNRDQTGTVAAGSGASFTYTFTTKNSATTWQVDSMKINGVYLEIPARELNASATTVIVPSENGEPPMTATLTITNVTRRSGGNTAYTYQLTINGAFEDVVIDDANLNNVTWAEVIPSATAGVTFQNKTPGSSAGLNEPTEIEGGTTPTYVFGLEDGYENLQFKLFAYNSSGEKQTYSSGISSDTIQLPTTAGRSTEVTWRSSGYWGTTYTVATVTLNTDGTYTVKFKSKNDNRGNVPITLQLLKVSAEKIQYRVAYDLAGGEGTVTDNGTYDVEDNPIAVVAAGQPTPPKEGTYFIGWKIQGDETGKVYETGDEIDFSGEEIQKILKSQTGENKNTLTLVAEYSDKLPVDKSIEVPVKIFLNDVEDTSRGYTVDGLVGRALTLLDIEDEITVTNGDGTQTTYKLVSSNSPIRYLMPGASFELRYETTGNLSIEKVAAGDESTKLAGAVFTLTAADGNTLTSAATTTAGITSFTDLRGGTYTLTETTAPDGYKTVTDTYTVTVKNGVATVQKNGENVELTDGALRIADEPEDKTVILKKVNGDGTIVLTGAEFTLQNTDHAYYSRDGNGTVSWVTEENRLTLTNGTFSLTDLPVGTYTLTEVKAPDGYLKLTNAITLTVGVKEVTASNESGSGISAVTENEDGTYTLTVKNSNGTALPNTGGPGTGWCTAVGLAAVVVSGLLLVVSGQWSVARKRE